ncbi:hypothetical protein GGTG_00513 [Gaeumannomyces tritici R3-111a-1]|uniref:Uncharacterized protein n=1 Tax=Gaeumannomyces tritici (strain R3-111a-1) TaxID=644352 RepID=J3NGX7_GAET3|nr:hypothetical protein GGTG_00513 [Gaeumannomyces tritici R3-111a-1]EJT80517.1 hypothetical protein GGTG_00513 [Gaeumannomyces tritici R3-111a-1]
MDAAPAINKQRGQFGKPLAPSERKGPARSSRHRSQHAAAAKAPGAEPSHPRNRPDPLLSGGDRPSEASPAPVRSQPGVRACRPYPLRAPIHPIHLMAMEPSPFR